MKKVFTAIAISISALIATTAMAGPNDQRDSRFNNSSYKDVRQDHRYNDRYNDRYEHRFNSSPNKNYNNGRYNSSVNPSREWRSGQALPRQFSSARYAVNREQIKRLPKVGRNQQWYKINGDYVLVNERNKRILRIIG